MNSSDTRRIEIFDTIQVEMFSDDENTVQNRRLPNTVKPQASDGSQFS